MLRVILLLITTLTAHAKAPVIDPYTLQNRVDRLEQSAQGKKNVDFLTKINEQQAQLRELRGQLEQQAYQLEQLKKSQSQMYMDLEDRLSILEEKKEEKKTVSTP